MSKLLDFRKNVKSLAHDSGRACLVYPEDMKTAIAK